MKWILCADSLKRTYGFCSQTTRALVGFCCKTWTRDALIVMPVVLWWQVTATFYRLCGECCMQVLFLNVAFIVFCKWTLRMIRVISRLISIWTWLKVVIVRSVGDVYFVTSLRHSGRFMMHLFEFVFLLFNFFYLLNCIWIFFIVNCFSVLFIYFYLNIFFFEEALAALLPGKNAAELRELS